MEPALQTEITEVFDKLIAELASIPEEAINIVPYAGSWTAGQLAEHIFKSVSGVPEMLVGPVEPTTRPPDQYVQQLKTVFLNYELKMQAPVFVQPSNGPHGKEKYLISYQETKLALVQAAHELDLTATCKGFEFPTMGYLTRLEWLTFALVHTTRHLHQLKKIHQSLALKI
jgi:hypothetical protein